MMDVTNLEALEVVQVRDYGGDRREDMGSGAMSYRLIACGEGRWCLTTHRFLI